MRKTKPIPEFQNLTPEQLNLVHSWLPSFPLREVMDRMASQFGVHVKYHKIHRYYHEWTLASQIQGTVDEVLHILNGDALPLNPVTEQLIQKAVFTMALRGNQSPAALLQLQRLASYPFNKEMAEARADLDQQRAALQQRRQATREKELAFKKEKDARKLELRAQKDRFHAPVTSPESPHPPKRGPFCPREFNAAHEKMESSRENLAASREAELSPEVAPCLKFPAPGSENPVVSGIDTCNGKLCDSSHCQSETLPANAAVL